MVQREKNLITFPGSKYPVSDIAWSSKVGSLPVEDVFLEALASRLICLICVLEG